MRDRHSDPTPREGDIVNAPGSFWHGATVIASITRAQLIDDGTLIDMTRAAMQQGIRLPLAMTATAFELALGAPRVDHAPTPMDLARFFAWLRFTICAAARENHDASQAAVTFTRIDNIPVDLKIVCGPGDRSEPVLTVMLPEED